MLDVDDLYPEHPKLLRLGGWCPVAGWLHLSGIAWSRRHLTDGLIPKAAICRLANYRGMAIDGEPVTPEAVVTRLVTARLWHDRGGDYVIHDFLDYQESRETVLERRRLWRDRQRKHRKSLTPGSPAPVSRVTPSVTRDSRVTLASPSPSQKQEEEAPDARARACSKWDATRAQNPRTHDPPGGAYVRHGPGRAGMMPQLLGDVLARAYAAAKKAPP
jgi:hypothetical protein